jgi:hypothetical protein
VRILAFYNAAEAIDYAERRRAEHPTGRVHRPVQAHEPSLAWAVCVDPVPYRDAAVLERVKRLVLDAVSSPLTRAMYGKAFDDFFAWREAQGNPAFTRAAVHAHRTVLQSKGYSPSTINLRLAAIKKLAREAPPMDCPMPKRRQVSVK